jgi:hypothetical protein
MGHRRKVLRALSAYAPQSDTNTHTDAVHGKMHPDAEAAPDAARNAPSIER